MRVPIKLAANLSEASFIYIKDGTSFFSFLLVKRGMSKNSVWCEGIWKNFGPLKNILCPLPLPAVYTMNAALLQLFFSCNLADFIFYLLYSFLRFMKDCKPFNSFGNPRQRITERGLSWDCLSKGKVLLYGEQIYHEDHLKSQLIYFKKSVFSFAH